MDRPDLNQSAWTRAKSDARVVSLDTFLGLLVTAAGGAAGGEIAARLDLPSTGLDVVAVTIGSLMGAGIGIAVFLGYHLLTATRGQRNDLRDFIRSRHEAEAKIAEFRGRCLQWAHDVEKHLHVQKAKEPTQPSQEQVVRSLMHNEPVNTPEQARERELIQRETVALYIEKYRDEGLKLVDALMEAGLVGPARRQTIADPQDLNGVSAAMTQMHIAADQL